MAPLPATANFLCSEEANTPAAFADPANTFQCCNCGHTHLEHLSTSAYFRHPATRMMVYCSEEVLLYICICKHSPTPAAAGPWCTSAPIWSVVLPSFGPRPSFTVSRHQGDGLLLRGSKTLLCTVAVPQIEPLGTIGSVFVCISILGEVTHCYFRFWRPIYYP